MNSDIDSQINELKSAIKKLPYREGKTVKETSVYFYSKLNAYMAIVTAGLFFFTGLIVSASAKDERLYICIAVILLSVWVIRKYLKQLTAKTPVLEITDTQIKYLDKIYPWSRIFNSETYSSSEGENNRETFHFCFDHENGHIDINISELDASLPSFLFQLYSHKLNYLKKFAPFYEHSYPPQNAV